MPDKKKVLIIEDDHDLLLILVRSAEDVGFRAVGAGSGAEGMLLALRETPDIIITDIIMPYVDGLMIIKKVRSAVGWGASVPIIAFTNLAARENEYMIQALSHGIYFHNKAETSLATLMKIVREKLSIV